MLTGRVWSITAPAAAPSVWPTQLCRLCFPSTIFLHSLCYNADTESAFLFLYFCSFQSALDATGEAHCVGMQRYGRFRTETKVPPCCREQTPISNRGAFVGKKKSAFLLSFSATAKLSRGNRFCTTVIIRPCGPSPPVLGSIAKVWLAAASGAERLATPAWRLRKEFSSCFLRRKKGKEGDKQAKKNNWDSPVPITLQYGTSTGTLWVEYPTSVLILDTANLG